MIRHIPMSNISTICNEFNILLLIKILQTFHRLAFMPSAFRGFSLMMKWSKSNKCFVSTTIKLLLLFIMLHIYNRTYEEVIWIVRIYTVYTFILFEINCIYKLMLWTIFSIQFLCLNGFLSFVARNTIDQQKI